MATSRVEKSANYTVMSNHHLRALPGLSEHIFLAVLILPDTGSSAVHEPFGAQQRQDDIPHDGEVIAVAPVFEGEGITARDHPPS